MKVYDRNHIKRTAQLLERLVVIGDARGHCIHSLSLRTLSRQRGIRCMGKYVS